jgi:Ca-activated chloride channel family protein
VEVLPARVKPGDPELRVEAGPDARAVRVVLPFERRAREAIRDPRRGDFVLRFLVPSGGPDGSFDARVTVVREGSVEERTVPIRVDTTPAAIAVLAAPRAVRPGEEIRLALKPAFPVARLVDFAGRPGGLANAVKGAMEVKEVLVRAPWGEVVRGRMDGPIGVYTATLRAPADAPEGRIELEVAAADAAGNVSRRLVPLGIRAEPPAAGRVAYASVAGAAALAAALVAALVALALLRRRRARPPLDRVLRAGSVKRARDL